MKDFTKESPTTNKQDEQERTNCADSHQKPICRAALQRTVASKIEITITRQQLNDAKWLFEQAGKQKPGWLRRKFKINQRRRKCLNDELIDAQLDKVYCRFDQNPEDWDGLLHLLWHQVNGVESCK